MQYFCGERFISLTQFFNVYILVFFLLGSVCSAAPLELMIVAYGSAAPMGLASLSSSTPAWELAVEDLHRKYPGSLNFSYILVPAKNCLAAAEKDGDVLAKWYYALRRPGRILVFLNTGLEFGKSWTPSAWNTVKEHYICLIYHVNYFIYLIPNITNFPINLRKLRYNFDWICVVPSFRNIRESYNYNYNLNSK